MAGSPRSSRYSFHCLLPGGRFGLLPGGRLGLLPGRFGVRFLGFVFFVIKVVVAGGGYCQSLAGMSAALPGAIRVDDHKIVYESCDL